MFQRLGHHRVICGHDQDDDVDTAGTCDHVSDEFFMARHIDDPDQFAVIERHRSKTEIDGQTPFLLLWQPIGVRPGQFSDQR